jgi:hypothetical protein
MVSKSCSLEKGVFWAEEIDIQYTGLTEDPSHKSQIPHLNPGNPVASITILGGLIFFSVASSASKISACRIEEISLLSHLGAESE